MDGKPLLALAFATAFLNGGCRDSAPAKPPEKQQGAVAQPPLPSPGASPSPMAGSTPIVGDKPALANMTLALRVYVLGIPFCEGTVHARLNVRLDPLDPNFKLLELPNSLLDCGIQKIDLSKLLSGVSKPSAAPAFVRDDLIFLKDVGDDTYEPGRPLMPAILTADTGRMKVLDQTVPVSFRSHTSPASSSGQVRVRTNEFQESVQLQSMQRTFQKVYDFEITNSGFDGVDRLEHFLFNRMALQMSLAPVALLSLDLETKVSDLLAVFSKDSTPPLSNTGAGSQTGGLGSGAQIGALGSILPLPTLGVGTSTQEGGLGSKLGSLGSLTGLIGKIVTVRIHGDLIAMEGLDATLDAGAGTDAGERIGNGH